MVTSSALRWWARLIRIDARTQAAVRREDFDPAAAEQHSKAAKAMCVWCRAMCMYDELLKELAPKTRRVQDLWRACLP